MEKRFYKSLLQHENCDELSSEGTEEACKSEQRSSSPTKHNVLLKSLCILLLVSFAANVFFIYQQYFVPWRLARRLPSKFAHLTYDFPVEIGAHSDFDNTNRTLQDQAWDDPDLEPWSLFLALDDDYSSAMGLPFSQRWPWDSHKGAYIATGAHELHCVRVLRTVINENHDGLPQINQTWPYDHVLHCLNILRDSVVCHADDTPMYTGRLHKNVAVLHPKAGVGMIKMCRNWSNLVSWARARSACYSPVHWFEKDFDDVERYKFCPDGSTPWKQIEGGKEAETKHIS